MHFLFRVLFTFLFLFPLVVSAETPRVELAGLLEQHQAFGASFEQKVFDGRHRLVDSSRGVMKLKRPGRFLWKVVDPIPQILVTDGKSLWNFEPDLDQVTVQDVVGSFGGTPAALLTDDVAVLDDFHVFRESVLVDKKVVVQFRLIAREADEDALFHQLKLHFSGGVLLQVEIWDALDNYTLVTFVDLVPLPGLKDKVFEFVVPPGIDVIRHSVS